MSTPKVALITGAARGIGRATALALAKRGVDLVITDIARQLAGVPYSLGNTSQLAATAQMCRQIGVTVIEKQADVRSSSELQAAVDAGIERFGTIDIAVANAGIASPSGSTVEDIEEDDWDLMIDIDLGGTWRLMKAVGPHMRARNSGVIITVASNAGLVGYRRFAGYVAAKHAVIGLTKAAALDFSDTGVRVNAVCPGSVRDDPALDGAMLAEIARCQDIDAIGYEAVFAAQQPRGVLMEAADIADAVTWLALTSSSGATGVILTMDGAFSHA